MKYLISLTAFLSLTASAQTATLGPQTLSGTASCPAQKITAKNGTITIQPAACPVTIKTPQITLPVNLSGTKATFTCSGGTKQPDGSITGLSCSLTVSK